MFRNEDAPVVTANSIRLAFSRESGNGSAMRNMLIVDLVGSHRNRLALTSCACKWRSIASTGEAIGMLMLPCIES
jgi:hypothetical protein